MAGPKKTLLETSMKSIWQHMEKANVNSITILTSWRHKSSLETNTENFIELKNKVRELSYRFVTVTGHWKECQDVSLSYRDCPVEQLIDVEEPALFILGIDKNTACLLGNEYSQDAIIFAGPSTNNSMVLIFKDGSQEPLGDFKLQTMGQAYKKLLRTKHHSK